MKRIIVIITILVVMISLVSCRFGADMPYNGDITFNEIGISIPQNFIRDSTQSSGDAWIFEKGFYKQMIIITRNDLSGEVDDMLNNYAAYMIEMGCDSTRTTFSELQAVHTTYMRDGQFCQEMLFVYNSSTYAIALRGGTEEDFQSLLDSVRLGNFAEETA